MSDQKLDILEQIKADNFQVKMDDPRTAEVMEIVGEAMGISQKINNSLDVNEIRGYLSQLTGKKIDDSVTVFAPFYVNFGKFLEFGKNVFINQDCTFNDMGGIIIEDNVKIGVRVNLVTVNHPLDPNNRRILMGSPIRIKKNAWLCTNATVLPGVTIGENSVVAAGALVTKDVPDNVVVAGVPAKVIKQL